MNGPEGRDFTRSGKAAHLAHLLVGRTDLARTPRGLPHLMLRSALSHQAIRVMPTDRAPVSTFDFLFAGMLVHAEQREGALQGGPNLLAPAVRIAPTLEALHELLEAGFGNIQRAPR